MNCTSVKKITRRELVEIALSEEKKPYGFFFAPSDKEWMGLKNIEGEAKIETFSKENDCLLWFLNHLERYESYSLRNSLRYIYQGVMLPQIDKMYRPGTNAEHKIQFGKGIDVRVINM